MTAFSNTSSIPGERMFVLGETSQMSSGPLSESGSNLPQQDAGDFAVQWARAQLSVRAYLNSFLSNRSAVDDCIQEVAILAWNKGPRGPVNDHFLAFCLACAKRIAMAEVRKKYRTRLMSLSPDVLASLSDTVARLEENEAAEPVERISALQLCLASMEPGPRHLLELRYSSKDPAALQNEAKSTGKSMDAIYKKLERLRTLLRECVTKNSTSRE